MRCISLNSNEAARAGICGRKLLVALTCSLAGFATIGTARVARTQYLQAPAASLPEPIYWKQNLFLVPYQWSSAADPGSATTVWLFVSKDRGASWHKISEAKPHVKAFTYHAEADGEYMFAIRTVDAQGQAWPAGPYQAELRVIVDTTMPLIDEFRGELLSDGRVAIRWHATDLNLDPNSWRVEFQSTPTAAWQQVPVDNPASGQMLWQVAGTAPAALRATVLDWAGNSAVYHCRISASIAGSRSDSNLPALVESDAVAASSSAGGSGQMAGAMGSTTPPSQQWPATATSRWPFRLVESHKAPVSGPETTFGSPVVFEGAASTPLVPPLSDGRSGWASPGAEPTAPELPQSPDEIDRFAMINASTGTPVRPLEPYREESTNGSTVISNAAPTRSDHAELTSPNSVSPSLASEASPQAGGALPAQLPSGVVARHVGARTFSLDYQLADMGSSGVSRVELWGTHDAGQSWQRFGNDEDHRTPMYVTVDHAGLYGFHIVVDAANGPTALVPRAGDEPELWVIVDLDRPHAELTSIEPVADSTTNQLILRWRAEDANLEPRPISLLYSSRSSGPWSPIATTLPNTGEYTWQIERHVPPHVYLRLEARDVAGNLGAFQTADAIDLPAQQPTAELRSASPVLPAATGAESAF